jgi:tetratricopeptide (TPR) repeat protein
MPTEKDGAPNAPPDSSEGFEDADDVTGVKPIRLPGLTLGGSGAPSATPAPPAPADNGHPAAPSETQGEVDSEVEVLDEDLLQSEAPEEGHSVLDDAIADAQAFLQENGHLRLIQLYERELEAIAAGEPDKARTALYQHEIGELLESRAADEGAAVKAYAKALQSDATLEPNLWAIRRVFERRQLWPNLQKLLDAEVRFARTPVEKAEQLVDKGQLLEDRLNDEAGALACYRKAVETFPGALGAWMALERLHARSGDLAALAQAVRGQADAVDDPARKVALLLDLGRLHASMPGAAGGPGAAADGLERAQAILNEALAIGVDAERVLDALEQLATASGRSEDLLLALGERAQRLVAPPAEAPPEERQAVLDKLIAIRRRQAQIVRERGELERAWVYLSQALQAAPGEPLVVRELSELGEMLGRWDELAELYAVRIESAPTARKIGLKLERARVLRRAGRAVEADAVEAEVAHDDPAHLGLLVARERAALAAGDWEKLAALYQAEAELANSDGTPTHEPDPLWAATALSQAAHALSQHLGRDVEAQKALTDALQLVPHFAPAVDALERLYMRTGKHAELAALYEAELQSESGAGASAPARAERLLEGLIAARESLDDAAGASAAARRLCELRPDDVRARLRLVELDRQAARFAEAADDLAALGRIVPDERRVEVLLERADLLEHRLNDSAAAADAYREALALRPGDPRAANAFEVLSRRRLKESRSSGAPPPQAWDDLARALRREAEASTRPQEIAQALLKLGEIHERERGNFADAAQAYRDLLDRVPGHAAALRGLARASLKLGEVASAADALEQEVEALAPEARPAALLALGELYEFALADGERAQEAYARARAADAAGASGTAAHAALGQLRVAVRGGALAQVAEALEGASGLLGSDGTTARAVLLDERAHAAAQADDREQARALERQAIELDGGARSALIGQARLAALDGDAALLGDALEALAARSIDPAWQAALGRRAGLLALAEGHAGVTTAARRLAQAQTLAASDAATLVALCDSGGADAEALGARARLAEGAARVDWLVEQAAALEAAGRLADAAREGLRALDLDPHHVPALELCRRIARRGGDALGHARATARLAAEVLDGERAAALFAEAGEALHKLGEMREAASAWRALCDRMPLDGAAFAHAKELMTALLAEDKQPGPLVELYSFRLEHVTLTDERVPLLIDRAQLYVEAGDRAQAEADLRAALALDPAAPEGLRRLGELLAASPAGHDEAIALFSRYLEDENDRDRRRPALLHLAELEEAVGRADEAVRYLEEAVRLARTPADARPEYERLAALLERQRQWQAAVTALRRLADLEEDDGARAEVELRVARIYRDGVGEPRAAGEALLRALRAQPMHMEALAQLMALAEGGHVLQLELEEKLENAIERARMKAKIDPRAPEPLQALVRLWGWRGDTDMGVIAQQAVALVSRRPPPPPLEKLPEPTKELSERSWERLLPEVARSVALDVWRAAGAAAAEVYGPPLDSLVSGKRLNAKGTPTAWVPVDRIARSLLGFGAGSSAGYELYASSTLDVCAAVGHALVCGGAFVEQLSPPLRFRVARRLALLRDWLGPVETMEEAELAVFFAACAKLADLPRPPILAGVNEARVEERSRALGKAIARRDKKALQAIGGRLLDLPHPGEWRHAVLVGAARAGLVIGGDLGAALGELGLDVQRDGDAQALILFGISEDYRVLRHELGCKG